jgi:zinc protease
MKTILRCFLATLLVLCVSIAPLTAQAPGAKPAPLQIPELKFDRYKLDNGLEVILSEDHRLPLVSVNLWYHVGAVNETAGRTGFAHLFEHMMFEGSKHVPSSYHAHYL